MKLVCLHGFMGAPAAWHAALAAWPDAPAAHCPQLPLHGHPAKHADCTSWDQALDLLAEELPADHDWVLAGYSMGARLALGLALRFRHKVKGLLAIGGHPGLGDASARQARQTWERTMAERLRGVRHMREFVQEWERLPLFANQRGEADRQKAQQQWREAHEPAVLARAFEVLGSGRMPDMTPALDQLRMPCLFAAGSLDAAYAEHARACAGLVPRGEHVLVADCGHNPLYEAPADTAQLLARVWQRAHSSGEAR